MLILQKVKNPPDGFFPHLFFASEIIVIFGWLFLHRLYRLLKSNINLPRVTKTDFARKKSELGGRIEIKVNPVISQAISFPEVTPEIVPLFSAQFHKIVYDIYTLQDWNPHRKLDLNLMGHHIVDKYFNTLIF